MSLRWLIQFGQTVQNHSPCSQASLRARKNSHKRQFRQFFTQCYEILMCVLPDRQPPQSGFPKCKCESELCSEPELWPETVNPWCWCCCCTKTVWNTGNGTHWAHWGKSLTWTKAVVLTLWANSAAMLWPHSDTQRPRLWSDWTTDRGPPQWRSASTTPRPMAARRPGSHGYCKKRIYRNKSAVSNLGWWVLMCFKQLRKLTCF